MASTVYHRYLGKDQKPPPPPKPTPAETAEKAANRALDDEYRQRRNRALELRNMREQMLIAKSRHELVPKEMVERQAGFLVVALRQAVMQIPQTHARRIIGLTDYEKAKAALTGMMAGLLGDLEDIPSRMTDPSFLKKLDPDSE